MKKTTIIPRYIGYRRTTFFDTQCQLKVKARLGTCCTCDSNLLFLAGDKNKSERIIIFYILSNTAHDTTYLYLSIKLMKVGIKVTIVYCPNIILRKIYRPAGL